MDSALSSVGPAVGHFTARKSRLARFWNVLAEPDVILERTAIEGLYWIKNHFITTTETSRIVLPSPRYQGYTIVYHGPDFSQSDHNGYEIYGIHLGQTDVLTFLAADGRIMTGYFVDCRRGSSTLHEKVALTFQGDPDRALVIERGIAHTFDNLGGMVTLNRIRKYSDVFNPDFNGKRADVLNVDRESSEEDFPVCTINRFKTPSFVCSLILKAQRIRLAYSKNKAFPFVVKIGEKTIVLTPRRKG